MTVVTEQQITLPAVLVEQGDVVYVKALDDWREVKGVRHYQDDHGAWHVTLEIGERDFLVYDDQSPVDLWRA